MLDIFKDGAEAWLQRIKSPIIGSFVLSFFAFNWKVIFFVVFSDAPILFRFWYFDFQTSIWTLLVCPVGAGLLIGLGTPFLNYFGSYFAKWPTEKHRVLTANSASVVMTAKAELATARLLSSAKFKKAALLDAQATREIEEANLSDEAREDLDKKLDDLADSEAVNQEPESTDSDEISRTAAQLTDVEVLVLRAVGQHGAAASVDEKLISDEDVREQYRKLVSNFTQQRMKVDFKAAADRLANKHLIRDVGFYELELTASGYIIYDALNHQS